MHVATCTMHDGEPGGLKLKKEEGVEVKIKHMHVGLFNSEFLMLKRSKL